MTRFTADANGSHLLNPSTLMNSTSSPSSMHCILDSMPQLENNLCTQAISALQAPASVTVNRVVSYLSTHVNVGVGGVEVTEVVAVEDGVEESVVVPVVVVVGVVVPVVV